MSRIVITPKYAGETKDYPFDFASRLVGAAETLVSAVATAAVYSGVDGSPASLVNASPTVLGTVATLRTQAGVVGVIYVVTVTGTSSTGQVMIMQAFLTVLPTQP